MPELVTILAALIAGAVSLVTITLSKEQKISEFRQAWIDALRADLASFFFSSRAFSRAMEARRIHGIESKDPGKVLFTPEKIGEIRATAAESFYRIKLRLNPDEAEHKELLRLLWQAIADQNVSLQGVGPTHDEVLAAVDRAADFAGPVLKAEWKRVKEGEKPYRVIRISATVVVIVALIAFAVVWIQGDKKPNQAPDRTAPSVTPPAAQEPRH